MTARMKIDGAPPDQKPVSRWQDYERANGYPPPMPILFEESEHIWDVFRGAGFAGNMGMGQYPLPMTEIDSYADWTGGLTGPEKVVVRQMSEAYIVGHNTGKEALEVSLWPVRDEDGLVSDDEINEGHDG